MVCMMQVEARDLDSQDEGFRPGMEFECHVS